MLDKNFSIMTCGIFLFFSLVVSLAHSANLPTPSTNLSSSAFLISPIKPSTNSQPLAAQVLQPIVPPSPAMQITSPTANQQLFVGGNYKIEWIKMGQMSQYVNIAIANSSVGRIPIASNVPNNGIYNWVPAFPQCPTCPTAVDLSGTYKIQIITIDNNVRAESAFFKLNNSYILLTKPQTNETLGTFGNSYTVAWNNVGITGSQVKIFLRKFSAPEEVLMADCPNNGYCWVPLKNQFILDLCASSLKIGFPCASQGLDRYSLTYDPNNQYILRIESNGGYKNSVQVQILRPQGGLFPGLK